MRGRRLEASDWKTDLLIAVSKREPCQAQKVTAEVEKNTALKTRHPKEKAPLQVEISGHPRIVKEMLVRPRGEGAIPA